MAVNACSDVDKGTTKMRKRPDFISWDDYFMELALLAVRRCKDDIPSDVSTQI